MTALLAIALITALHAAHAYRRQALTLAADNRRLQIDLREYESMCADAAYRLAEPSVDVLHTWIGHLEADGFADVVDAYYAPDAEIDR